MNFRSDHLVRVVGQFGDDQYIADSARVSTLGQEGRPYGSLIETLMKEEHGSPFEAGYIGFHIYTPKFVRDQMVRHRAGVGFNIQSERYAPIKWETADFWVPAYGRPLAQTGKAMDYNLVELDASDYAARHYDAVASMRKVARTAMLEYDSMLEEGIPREVARSVLPSSLYTNMRVHMNPRSLLHFLALRATLDNKSKPQHEISEVADHMATLAENYWPETMSWFRAQGGIAP